ncbi:MAG: oligosaccharide flippase family protein [Lachnospiraceae bacterium]|nr:oligosaccharide flippase family protein [Lachnospiraceae bacterium]
MSMPVLKLSPGKRAFLTGTLLLTGTGFLCRILGFFYRIFLSRTIGAEGLGIYNMVHPVFGICFAVCAGSIQTALSQYVAANQKRGRAVFHTGLAVSLALSFLMAGFICRHAGFIAEHILLEPRCAPYLNLMALSVPFAALHACINGLYYGMQKSRVPAFSQVAEQVVRMAAVCGIVRCLQESGRPITVTLAVWGHLIGEMASAAFTLFCLAACPPCVSSRTFQKRTGSGPKAFGENLLPLMTLALPLIGNRLVLNLLGSAEAIWIPNRLTAYGLSSGDAFSVYGVLTGMALPFILFPSAVTNSIAVLLLPSVAKAQAEKNQAQISAAISMALRYSSYMGILCTGIFCLYGRQLGTSVFRSPSAGAYIRTLGWLCPFMYLATTLGSILNGLGKTSATFLQNVCALCLRLVFVLIGIPKTGMQAYLAGLLISEIFLAFWHLSTLRSFACFRWNAAEMIGKPVLLLLTGGWLTKKLWSLSVSRFHGSFLEPGTALSFFGTALQIGMLCSIYGGLLLGWHLLKRRQKS